jgi:hypothetical protein
MTIDDSPSKFGENGRDVVGKLSRERLKANDKI